MPNKMFFCRSWVIISDFPLGSNGDLGITHSSPHEVRIVQGLVRKGFLLLVLDCIKTKSQVERQNAITVHWKSSSQDYLSDSADSVVKSVVNRIDSAVI
ncbi:hypothetical protein RGQ29_001311 [Quercus rubra]|uniref:Uncharacterized protein n=1 Tax=Quercus rubra TaxID=3512 RepID=A0AAN7GB40_QUERU|nr:hypothetical protein RGQ29_001311 [Quercus rubra]